LVPALALPAVEAGKPVTRAVAAASEAIRLFVERTQAVRPSFELREDNVPAIAHICRRLDGLPLAIELAAARARVLDPQQIAARLDDVFGLLSSGSRTAAPRQRTLRATIEWSHALLTEPERILFRRLAIFAGGWQERLVEDIGNLRAAADWFEQDPTAVDDNLRFAAALHWFWFGLGHYREARRRIETALERSGGARTRARGRALSSLATYLA